MAANVQYAYQYNGETYTVDLESHPDGSFHATIGGRTYTVQPRRAGGEGWLLLVDGKSSLAYAAASGSERYVYVGGQTYTLTVPDARRARRKPSGAESGAQLTAQMPGQVIDVRVAEGQRVEKGQTLVILEAMKMEIRVAAPYDGLVRRLLVSAGAMVERGQLLVEIETENRAGG